MTTNLARKNSINTFLNTYFNLFVIVFVCFLLFGAYLFIIQPKIIKTSTAISENITSQQKLLQAQKTKLTNLQRAILAYGNIDKVDAARVNAILPDSYDKELLFGEIEELITRNGFVPTSIALVKQNASIKEASSISDKIGVVNITLGIASVDYAGLKNLLSVLENNLRLIDVKNVSLSGGHSGSLNLSTYYYKK